jgi:hypothetical protein
MMVGKDLRQGHRAVVIILVGGWPVVVVMGGARVGR